MKDIFVSNSEIETFSYGKEIASKLVAGDILALVGNLGSGKTILTKGIANGIGIVDVVNSPTFKLINEYNSIPPLYHFDFYRIKSLKEIIDFGIEYYYSNNGVCIIEWANLFPNIIPNSAKWFIFEIEKNQNRKIIFKESFEN